MWRGSLHVSFTDRKGCRDADGISEDTVQGTGVGETMLLQELSGGDGEEGSDGESRVWV